MNPENKFAAVHPTSTTNLERENKGVPSMKYLSRLFLAISCVAILASGPAFAQGWGPLTTSPAAVTGTTTGAGTTAQTMNATAVAFHVYSASSSVATVTIEQSVNGSAWYTSATITNPSSVGELWTCPAAGYARMNITAHTSGTITGVQRQRNLAGDPVAVGCKRIDSYTGFTFATGTGTLAVSSGKAVSVTGSLTFAGTDATTMTFPSTSASVARTDDVNTFTGIQTFSSPITGALKTTIAAKLTDGAIASAPGVIVITKASALGSSTLATPTTTTHDGYVLTIVSSTAFAHVVTVTTGKLNAAAVTTVTFTSAAVGDSLTLVAFQGIWYLVAKTGTITLS